jgi:hypothetical protein
MSSPAGPSNCQSTYCAAQVGSKQRIQGHTLWGAHTPLHSSPPPPPTPHSPAPLIPFSHRPPPHLKSGEQPRHIGWHARVILKDCTKHGPWPTWGFGAASHSRKQHKLSPRALQVRGLGGVQEMRGSRETYTASVSTFRLPAWHHRQEATPGGFSPAEHWSALVPQQGTGWAGSVKGVHEGGSDTPSSWTLLAMVTYRPVPARHSTRARARQQYRHAVPRTRSPTAVSTLYMRQ